MTVQFATILARYITHTYYPSDRLPKLPNVAELLVNRQVIDKEFHLFTPASKVIHVLVELVEETLWPNIDVS